MINSVTNKNRNYIFNDVTQKTSDNVYWQKTEPKNDEILGVIKIMTPEEARKTHNFALIGLSIAGTMVFIASGIFFVLKGGPKGIVKNFQKMRDFFERKIQKAKLEDKTNTFLTKLYQFMFKSSDKLISKFEILNNWNTIKDFALKKVMVGKNEKNISSKIHNGISKLFEKIGRRAVVSAYEETTDSFGRVAHLHMRLDKQLVANSKNPDKLIKINGIQKTETEWIKELRRLNSEFDYEYLDNFSEPQLLTRYKKIKTSAQNLEQDFREKGILWFWSKDTLNKFVAESKIAQDKIQLQKSVNNIRKNLSYSLSDLSNDADKTVLEMTKLVNIDEIEKIKLLQNLREEFKMLAKNSDLKLKDKILSEIDILKNNSSENKALLSLAEELHKSVSNFKEGKLEQILTIYKSLLSPKQYKDVEHAYKGSIKSLDDSIKTETEDFFSKIRDLTMGSAPTDIISMLGALITLGYYLAKSESNQERASVTLKYGIPAIAGIGTVLYCNAKLFAGSKSLLIGAISTVMVGKIGDIANNLLLHYLNKNKAQK